MKGTIAKGMHPWRVYAALVWSMHPLRCHCNFIKSLFELGRVKRSFRFLSIFWLIRIIPCGECSNELINSYDIFYKAELSWGAHGKCYSIIKCVRTNVYCITCTSWFFNNKDFRYMQTCFSYHPQIPRNGQDDEILMSLQEVLYHSFSVAL